MHQEVRAKASNTLRTEFDLVVEDVTIERNQCLSQHMQADLPIFVLNPDLSEPCVVCSRVFFLKCVFARCLLCRMHHALWDFTARLTRFFFHLLLPEIKYCRPRARLIVHVDIEFARPILVVLLKFIRTKVV